MSDGVSRRDVLRTLLGAPLLAHWTLLEGCGSSRRRTPSSVQGELRGPNVTAGHRLRRPEGARLPASRAPAEQVEVAIVGGGPAGLSAAWRLIRRGVTNVRIYELEDVPGGTSRSGESDLTAYPWGAHYLPLPMAHNTDLIGLLREMGALEETAGGQLEGAEQLLIREPESRVFYRGFWYPGLYPFAGASEDDLAQLRRFEAQTLAYARMRDAEGRRAFSIPLALSSRDASLTALDGISATRWLAEQGYSSERLLWLVDYACRDDYGLRASQTSAWAMLFYWAARIAEGDDDASEVLTWPEGNGALVEHLARVAGERVKCGEMAMDIAPAPGAGDANDAERPGATGTDLLMHDVARDMTRIVRAQHVIVATPRFIARRIVRGLDEVDRAHRDAFEYSAWMVANVQLDARPRGLGYGECWDNVIYDSPSVGYVTATHQRGRDHGPTHWTHYWPMPTEDLRDGRRHLFDAEWPEWRDAVLADLSRPHRAVREAATRIDIWRWGHAMVAPRPGFLFGGAREVAQRPHGQVHFAHSDLSGVALFEESFFHGLRAADEVLAARARRIAEGRGEGPA